MALTAGQSQTLRLHPKPSRGGWMSAIPRSLTFAAFALLAVSLAGCKSGGTGGINGDTTTQAADQAAQQYPAQDPASANIAPISNASDNTGQPSGEYAAPQTSERQRSRRPQYRDDNNDPAYGYDPNGSGTDQYAGGYAPGDNYDDYSGYEHPVDYAPEPPPELAEYQQPPCPGENYVWTPGYWNYDQGQGYYWVPGAWVLAPVVGPL